MKLSTIFSAICASMLVSANAIPNAGVSNDVPPELIEHYELFHNDLKNYISNIDIEAIMSNQQTNSLQRRKMNDVEITAACAAVCAPIAWLVPLYAACTVDCIAEYQRKN